MRLGFLDLRFLIIFVVGLGFLVAFSAPLLGFYVGGFYRFHVGGFYVGGFYWVLTFCVVCVVCGVYYLEQVYGLRSAYGLSLLVYGVLFVSVLCNALVFLSSFVVFLDFYLHFYFPSFWLVHNHNHIGPSAQSSPFCQLFSFSCFV